ncbi:hypothetical protein CAEBREN_06531 [Caenorhabditis brenneri]|uniref:Pan3 C-terminal knob domain-containing protein n=1 Tax=Caenorhabditis brenneri TaxID=135651 RepID=G0MKC0_CAEBE|nr:hypothetical protein CAEBREN_06531 [Caenorhabditis brenneri]
MQPGEGYQYDGGPSGHGHQIPAGSRLNQYLANNNRQGPSFGPGTPININAPVFVPKNQQPQPPPPPPPPTMVNQFAQLSIHDVPMQMVPFGQINSGPPSFTHMPHVGHRPPSHHQPPPPMVPQPSHHQQSAYDRYQQENRGGTTYFYQEPTEGPPEEEHYPQDDIPEGCIAVNTPGVFNYIAPLPMSHMARFRGKPSANQQTQFISPELRMELLSRQLAFDAKPDPSVFPDIPQSVEHFSRLVPLENTGLQNQSQTTFKAFSCRDGNYYCLRRIHALIFVYDYYPLAETLMVKHFDMKSSSFFDPNNAFRIASPMAMPISITANGANETLIWSYIIQIAAALRAIHGSGLACRSLDLNKIICYGNKIMLSFCGMHDVLDPDSTPIQQLQNEDLNMFGNVIVALATGRANGYRKDLYQNSKKFIEEHFSIDLRNVIGFLHNNGTRKTINEVMPMIGGRFFTVMENMQAKCDVYEAELTREMENGRLFRLVAKMNTVLERVEHGSDEGWAETGDRFMLKLFRDYVFHQVTDQGKAWLDMAHIVQCLNKLDCGSPEKIEMVSRSGDTQIIIDYATLKRCLDKSFRELLGSNMIHR